MNLETLKRKSKSWLILSTAQPTKVTDQDTYWNRHGGSYVRLNNYMEYGC